MASPRVQVAALVPGSFNGPGQRRSPQLRYLSVEPDGQLNWYAPGSGTSFTAYASGPNVLLRHPDGWLDLDQFRLTLDRNQATAFGSGTQLESGQVQLDSAELSPGVRQQLASIGAFGLMLVPNPSPRVSRTSSSGRNSESSQSMVVGVPNPNIRNAATCSANNGYYLNGICYQCPTGIPDQALGRCIPPNPCRNNGNCGGRCSGSCGFKSVFGWTCQRSGLNYSCKLDPTRWWVLALWLLLLVLLLIMLTTWAAKKAIKGYTDGTAAVAAATAANGPTGTTVVTTGGPGGPGKADVTITTPVVAPSAPVVAAPAVPVKATISL